MKRIPAISLVLVLVCLLPGHSRVEQADVVFVGGNIYTGNERQPHAEAVAVKASKIIFVGSNKDAKAYQGRNTRVIDLHGNTVVPGMTDSHYHLSGVGAREMNLNLECITSLEAFLAKE